MTFSNQAHESSFRVYYEDTDAGGIVYHANYLKYAERGRSDALRELGIHQQRLREELGIFFVLRHCDITFLAPLMLDDEFTVRSSIHEFGHSSLKMSQNIWRDSLEIARMMMHIVCVSNERRPVRVPENVRDALAIMAELTQQTEKET